MLRQLGWLAAGVMAALTAQAEVRVQVVDGQGQPLADAVVSIQAPGTPASTAVMDQVGKQFVPRVLAVSTGTAVAFPNRDDIRHHVYSFSEPKRFELRLYHGTPSQPVQFDSPGLVVLGCNIHDWMVGYIYVSADPWVAVTDVQGIARFALPAGDYPLTLWHPDWPQPQPWQGRAALSASTPALPLAVRISAAAPAAAPSNPFAEAFQRNLQQHAD